MRFLVPLAKACLIMLGLFVITGFGYAWIADYGDSVASGKYEASADGQITRLALKSDHTFHQTRTTSNGVIQGDGTWRRIGEGGIVFSGKVLAVPNQRIMPNGDAYAVLNKTAGIWPPFISLDSTTTAPIYRKKLF